MCPVVCDLKSELSSQERLTAWLVSVKLAFDKRGNKLSEKCNTETMMKLFNMGTDVTKPFEYLLATGNLTSKSGRATGAQCDHLSGCEVAVSTESRLSL